MTRELRLRGEAGLETEEIRRVTGPGTAPDSVPLTPQQHGILLDTVARRGGGHHVEQLAWRWYGPLDTGRFAAAWQSVFDREAVLRAGFDLGGGMPRAVLYGRADAEVVRHTADCSGYSDWEALRARDRLRGFDLWRPGPLRVTLVDDPGPPPGHHNASTRVLLTFHNAALDDWSVAVLLQEFYRAYLQNGSLPGGERRPDIRDYARWLTAQDAAPARAFWSAAVPPGTPAVLPALPGPATTATGWGRTEARLGAAATTRLRDWAAAFGATESGALQAVWALLLHRASGARGPAPVGFGVAVSGRGIALESVERLPGPLRNVLPVTVGVDPAGSVTGLLTELRDRALDTAAYEWVAASQIHDWSGRSAGEKLLDTLIVFDRRPRMPADLRAELAAEGIGVGPPAAAGAQTAFPVTLHVRGEPGGGLVLAVLHDRSRLADAEAAVLVRLCARLLRELCASPQGTDNGRAPHGGTTTTVADVLGTLTADAMPRIAGLQPGACRSPEFLVPALSPWSDRRGGGPGVRRQGRRPAPGTRPRRGGVSADQAGRDGR